MGPKTETWVTLLAYKTKRESLYAEYHGPNALQGIMLALVTSNVNTLILNMRMGISQSW